MYYEPIPELSDGLPAPFPGLLILIWQLREKDLQMLYPLETLESRLSYLSWCVIHGVKEYRALHAATDFWRSLFRKAELGEFEVGDPGHAISWQMLLLLNGRKDLDFDLSSRMGRAQFLVWYLMHGRDEIGRDYFPIQQWQSEFFATTLDGLSNLQRIVHEARHDLQQTFPFATRLGEYLKWFQSELHLDLQTQSCVGQYSMRNNVSPYAAVSNDGVNLFGYVKGELGIGEDVRMAANALDAAKVPFDLVNFDPGKNISCGDQSLSDRITNEARYSLNVFCLTALEHARYFAQNGPDLLTGRTNVGYWPWELPSWPEEWSHLFALVDEVWVSSRYTQRAIKTKNPKETLLMPMAVSVDAPSGTRKELRKAFGLPESDLLFFFAFDFNSASRRKNPQACIDAFLLAFPKSDNAKVGLVIKAHGDLRSSDAKRLLSLARKDSRIHVLTGTLPKNVLISLYDACDAFISLHRAEGFGRAIAEAMLLGKAVIVTGYSGNRTFTSKRNALLVGFTKRALRKHDYVHGNGQTWAEPDIRDAAEKLRMVFFRWKDGEADVLAKLGQKTIQSAHSPASVGARYRRRVQILKTTIREQKEEKR